MVYGFHQIPTEVSHLSVCWWIWNDIGSGKRRRDYTSIRVSLFPVSVQTHHSPGQQKGFPFLSFFPRLASSPLSSHSPSAPNSPPRENDAESIFISIMGKSRGCGGSSSTPSTSCDTILAQSTHLSSPLFHVNTIHPPLPSSGKLSIHLSFVSSYPPSHWPLSLLLLPFYRSMLGVKSICSTLCLWFTGPCWVKCGLCLHLCRGDW